MTGGAFDQQVRLSACTTDMCDGPHQDNGLQGDGVDNQETNVYNTHIKAFVRGRATCLASKEATMAESRAGSVRLPIDWHCGDEITSRYATEMTVQHTDQEFLLSFYEIIPPVLSGSPHERKAQAEALGQVRANCLARIIVSAARMPGFIKAMNENLRSFQSMQGQAPEVQPDGI